MLKTYWKLIISVLSTFVVIALLFFVIYTNFDGVGRLLKIPNFGVKTIEKIIDNNPNFWTEYNDQNFVFKYPMYLSPFNDISATELTTKDERVANYLRRSDSEAGDSMTGRSYSIILMQKHPYFKTQNLDVKDWIIENRLNIQNRDCTTCSEHPELPIEETQIGGKQAFSISAGEEESSVPRTQTMYFQTSDGIASIGYTSSTPSEYLINDYKVFKGILESFTFLK